MELTLNMLRTSRINPKLSAHEQLHGIHDFNATPLAPPGTRCIAHEKSSQCGTWAPHEQHGWYVRAAPEHYRCYQIYIPKTLGTRICDTVEFFPSHCKMPNVTSHDAVIYAANDLITALTMPQPTNSVLSIGNDQNVALRKLATIFQCSIQQKQQPIVEPGEPDIALPQRLRTRSQTKALANAAIRDIYSPTVSPTTTQPRNDPEKDVIQFPSKMYENWVRYGLAKLGQISRLPNWQRMLFCAYTTQLLLSTGEVCWNNNDSYFIWFEFVCRNSGQIASRRSWKRSCLGLEYTSKCSRLALLWEPN